MRVISFPSQPRFGAAVIQARSHVSFPGMSINSPRFSDRVGSEIPARVPGSTWKNECGDLITGYQAKAIEAPSGVRATKIYNACPFYFVLERTGTRGHSCEVSETINDAAIRDFFGDVIHGETPETVRVEVNGQKNWIGLTGVHAQIFQTIREVLGNKPAISYVTSLVKKRSVPNNKSESAINSIDIQFPDECDIRNITLYKRFAHAYLVVAKMGDEALVHRYLNTTMAKYPDFVKISARRR